MLTETLPSGGTLTYLSRDDWGAGPLEHGHAIPDSQIVGLAAHHTVFVLADWDGDGITRGDLDDVVRYMRTLQGARPDLGLEVPYSFVVFYGVGPADVIVAEGRGPGRTGAHTRGFNSTRYGVAFAGNSSTQPVTDGVIDGYRWVGARMLVDPARARATFGHRDVKATECPGHSLYARLDSIQPPFRMTTTQPPAGGFLMALTEQEQREILDAARSTQTALRFVQRDDGDGPTGPVYVVDGLFKRGVPGYLKGWLTAHRGVPASIVPVTGKQLGRFVDAGALATDALAGKIAAALDNLDAPADVRDAVLTILADARIVVDEDG